MLLHPDAVGSKKSVNKNKLRSLIPKPEDKWWIIKQSDLLVFRGKFYCSTIAEDALI